MIVRGNRCLSDGVPAHPVTGQESLTTGIVKDVVEKDLVASGLMTGINMNGIK